eukprot:283429-Pleurochrysis_carterae.AAC.2
MSLFFFAFVLILAIAIASLLALSLARALALAIAIAIELQSLALALSPCFSPLGRVRQSARYSRDLRRIQSQVITRSRRARSSWEIRAVAALTSLTR